MVPDPMRFYSRKSRTRHNLVENAIRPTAIGKKNWLFFGDADAGQRSAIIYTIIESCRRRGLTLTRISLKSSRACRIRPIAKSPKSSPLSGAKPAVRCKFKPQHKRRSIMPAAFMNLPL